MKLDNLHFNFSEVDGYDKPFTFVISEREAGKSTALWNKVYNQFKKNGTPSIVIRRQIADITQTYIMDIQEVINKFHEEDPVSFRNNKNHPVTINQGVVDIYVEGKLFLRVIALSNPMSRIKSLIVRNLKYIVFDEFICNMRVGEKYLADEAFKFKELYNTFQRETDNLKCYFCGNPYSLYNPYFVWIGVDTSKLKRGNIVTGKNWVVQCYEIKPELRELILKKNPLYQFDDSYTKYAFEGQAINDMNIQIEQTCPPNFKLKHVFRIHGKYLGVYLNCGDLLKYPRYWTNIIEYTGERRKVYCFDFNDLVHHTVLMNTADKINYYQFCNAIRNRDIMHSSIECNYLCEEIYETVGC